MTEHEEITKLWRATGKEANFIIWLNAQEKKCEFCKEPCGKPWCPTNEEEDNETINEG